MIGLFRQLHRRAQIVKNAYHWTVEDNDCVSVEIEGEVPLMRGWQPMRSTRP